VVRAAHLWFAPVGGELTLEIKLQPGDTRLGFAISRTEEVIHTDESTPGVASMRSGLLELYHRARRASKLPAGEMLPVGRPCMCGRGGKRIMHLVQAVWSDAAREEVGDGVTGSRTAMRSGMTMGTPSSVSRPKAGSPKDGVGDGDSDGVA
jgi:hypothetical protein